MSHPHPSVHDQIRFHRLTGDDGVADLDWRYVAAVLAEQVDYLAMRLSGSPGTSPADEERIARAAVALKQYRAACAEHDDPT